MKSNRLYYITSFICGVCVMGIELSATRLLSPYVGSSNLTWTIIICLILVGIGIGNSLGGILADRYEKPDKLYFFIGIAGIFVMFLPLLAQFVIPGLLSISRTAFGSTAILITTIGSSIVLFFFPLLMLGMVSPFLAKLCVVDLKTTGKSVGRIYLLSTVGSIIGSILPSFVLIPTIGVRRSFLLFGACLIMLFLVKKMIKKRYKFIAAILAALAVFTTGADFVEHDNIIHQEESMYNYLAVYYDPYSTALLTNLTVGIQSKSFDEAVGLTNSYYDYLATLPLFLSNQDEEKDVLLIGYGAGTIPHMMDTYYSNINLTGVELDESVLDIADTYFRSTSTQNVIASDGRAFLSETDEKYDIIIVDVYSDMTIPPDFATVEFFELCKQHLNEEGILGFNIAFAGTYDSPLTSAISNSLYLAMDREETEANIFYIDFYNSSNGILMAGKSSLDMSYNENHVLSVIAQDMKADARPVTFNEGASTLTDDVSNIELLQMNVMSSYFN